VRGWRSACVDAHSCSETFVGKKPACGVPNRLWWRKASTGRWTSWPWESRLCKRNAAMGEVNNGRGRWSDADQMAFHRQPTKGDASTGISRLPQWSSRPAKMLRNPSCRSGSCLSSTLFFQRNRGRALLINCPKWIGDLQQFCRCLATL